MARIAHIMERWKATGQAILGSPLAVDEVRSIERTLGLQLPAAYRDFLQVAGWLQVRSEFVYGAEGRDANVGVVRRTLAERRMNPAFGATSIVVRDVGNGDCVFVDCSSGPQAGMVYRYDHELDETEEVAPGFEEWLATFVEG
ncbi:MAG: SMI1/KNR4 family protein [Phycisphaerales bacterium JB039]